MIYIITADERTAHIQFIDIMPAHTDTHRHTLTHTHSHTHTTYSNLATLALLIKFQRHLSLRVLVLQPLVITLIMLASTAALVGAEIPE